MQYRKNNNMYGAMLDLVQFVRLNKSNAPP